MEYHRTASNANFFEKVNLMKMINFAIALLTVFSGLTASEPAIAAKTLVQGGICIKVDDQDARPILGMRFSRWLCPGGNYYKTIESIYNSGWRVVSVIPDQSGDFRLIIEEQFPGSGKPESKQ